MLTPNDIETAEFKKVALGYSVDEVDTFLDKVIVEFEKLFKDNAKMQTKLNAQEEQIKYYKELEDTIRSSIIRAEKNVEETKRNAEVEAKQIIKAAEQQAKDILTDADKQHFKLESDILRLKTEFEALKGKLRILLDTEINMLEHFDDDFSEENEEN